MPVEYVVLPPRIFLVFLAAVLLVVLVSMLVKRGSTARKITALVIVLVVIGIVALLFYRPTVVTVSEQGFVLKRFRERTVAWSEVSEATRIEDLSVSEHRTARRIVGVSLGTYRVGTFRLQDGGTARAAMEQDRNALLIVTAAGERYLFALNENDKLVEVFSRFTAVGGQ
jgi:hypothetical protein